MTLDCNPDNIIIVQRRPGIWAVVEVDIDDNEIQVLRDDIATISEALNARNFYRNLMDVRTENYQ